MARAEIPGRLTWQLGKVVESVEETARTKSISFDVPHWRGHLAGQHVDVRLTAEDGYQAERSYSIASAPEDRYLVLTVERLEDGEVSPYLTDELRPGDELEIRGPIDTYFVWERSLGGPLLLVAGGSGVAPFRSMLRHWAAGERNTVPRLVYSSRSLDDVIYHDELNQLSADDGLDVQFALTREWPDDWKGHRGRVDRAFLEEVAWAPDEKALVYVCGPTPFVEAVAEALVGIGYQAESIKTERFGPTGT